MTTVREIHKAFIKDVQNKVLDAESLSIYKEIGMDRRVKNAENDIKIPHLKRIYFRDVEKICKKYRLAIGRLDSFTGHIPEKNLIQIHQFCKKYVRFYVKEDFIIRSKTTEFMTRKEAVAFRDKTKFFRFGYDRIESTYTLFICAPKKDMLEDLIETKKSLKLDDPIVLAIPSDDLWMTHPKDDATCYIVTAWGDEANDAIVFNERMN